MRASSEEMRVVLEELLSQTGARVVDVPYPLVSALCPLDVFES